MKHLIRLSVLYLLLSVCMTINAQVTVGSELQPEKAALLDLKTQNATTLGGATTEKGGVLLPRVSLEDKSSLKPFFTTGESDYADQKKRHTGLMVYNVYENATLNLEKGIYIWDGNKWGKAADSNSGKDFFYMPSIAIDTTTPVTGRTLNLYNLYKQQFLAPKVVSQGAPSQIPVFQNATDLYYYVTDYDVTVFKNISISNTGIMTYDILSQASSSSYINIVFVIK